MSDRVVSATEFRAKCLALLDEVESTGSTITVTRRGKAVAAISPPLKRSRQPLEGLWADKRKKLEQMLEKDTSYLWAVDSEINRRRG